MKFKRYGKVVQWSVGEGLNVDEVGFKKWVKGIARLGYGRAW